MENDTFELTYQELSPACEAILFASGDPIPRDRICEILNVDDKTVEEVMEEQAKKAEVRLLADHDEHISVTERQSRAAKIFHMYDDLPISYSVYKVTLGDDGQVDDATMFYVNHAFEKRGNLTASEILGKSTRELFPTMGPDWYDIVRRAAFEGEIITDKLYYEPTGHTYFMTASPVIHSGYCCFTYQELDV